MPESASIEHRWPVRGSLYGEAPKEWSSTSQWRGAWTQSCLNCEPSRASRTSAATHRPAGVRPSPDRQRIEEARAHGLTRRVSNEVPRDFGCTSWASGAGLRRASDGFLMSKPGAYPKLDGNGGWWWCVLKTTPVLG
jgi:hypothetical protein